MKRKESESVYEDCHSNINDFIEKRSSKNSKANIFKEEESIYQDVRSKFDDDANNISNTHSNNANNEIYNNREKRLHHVMSKNSIRSRKFSGSKMSYGDVNQINNENNSNNHNYSKKNTKSEKNDEDEYRDCSDKYNNCYNQDTIEANKTPVKYPEFEVEVQNRGCCNFPKCNIF